MVDKRAGGNLDDGEEVRRFRIVVAAAASTLKPNFELTHVDDKVTVGIEPFRPINLRRASSKPRLY